MRFHPQIWTLAAVSRQGAIGRATEGHRVFCDSLPVVLGPWWLALAGRWPREAGGGSRRGWPVAYNPRMMQPSTRIT
jgi:hypothetical protein